MATRTLTELELRILAFEAEWEGRPVGLKGHAGRVEFGWSPTAYEQKLQALLTVPAALEVAPMLVHRSIRLREARARARRSRHFGRLETAG